MLALAGTFRRRGLISRLDLVKSAFWQVLFVLRGASAERVRSAAEDGMKILKGFSFGDDKLDAVRTLWPRVLDRDNAFQLYGAFNFQGEKDELKQIIGR